LGGEFMKRKLVTAVWEITMKCNMRCKHCGSSCADKLPDELTTEEALRVCDELGELGMRYIAISGGEPTTREDWHLIVKRLRENGVKPNMITNGWLITEEILDKAVESGISSICISIDGLEETHDFMRRKGSFSRSMNAFELAKKKNISTSAITTINKKNIGELEELREVLIARGVKRWQLQIGLPMGNLENNSYLVLDPEQIDDIIDFAYRNINDDRIIIHLADCIGYYSFKDIAVRKAATTLDHYLWRGCLAGKYSIGILHNGDIVACTSIRDKRFVEGNVREKSIKEIWTNPEGFKWSKEMAKSKLKGFCSKCAYGDVCLGGCTNTRLCMEKDMYGENRYCSYSVAVKKEQKKIKQYTDPEALYLSALKLSEQKQFQIAELLTERGLEIERDNIKILSLHGYVNYMLGNYEISKQTNEKVLTFNSENAYANKGLGLCLSKLGNLEKGLIHLKKAMKLCDIDYMDPYYDCAITLIEHNRKDEASVVLKEAREKSDEFYQTNKELYKSLSI
jgi:radical SAM protein with 4Fe4S-binding SPASM domain